MAKIPVVFTFDKRIVLGAAVAIQSLIDCAKPETEYDIYVYHSDIPKKEISEFERMVDGTRHNITFEFINKNRFKNAPINKGGSWTEIVYYRLLIPELLPQYDKVIYSDVDVLFKEDLSDLYDLDIENSSWMGVRAEKNSEKTICHKYFPENKNEFIFWSGLMLINAKKCREDNAIIKLMNNVKIFNKRLKFFDLDLLNLSFNDISALPLKYCVLESLVRFKDFKTSKDYAYLKDVYQDIDINSAISAPAIIHYAGELGKPWHRKKVPLDYEQYIQKIPKALKKYTFRDLRKRFFSKI